MLCPNCKSKMTFLFTSAVCDVCDPPGGVKKAVNAVGPYKGWIATRLGFSATHGKMTRVFRTLDEIRTQYRDADSLDYYEVSAPHQIMYNDERYRILRPGSTIHDYFDVILVGVQ